MKHQYFGDINDFYKYGLLQILCGAGKLRLGVCWMLTPDDGRNDGFRTAYLADPDRWRAYNPRLFDFLVSCPKGSGTRKVTVLESSDLLPGAQFHSEELTDSGDQRRSYFSEMQEKFAQMDLIFLDPDNGLEVASTPFGARNSSKYLYWHEVSEVYSARHSVLIYQHFPREERGSFVAMRAATLRRKTSAAEVHSFRTAHVVYFLAPHKKHIVHFRRAAARVQELWTGQFEVRCYRSDESWGGIK
jgi:hypothetical protein